MECLEQGSRGSILQFMPFTMVGPAAVTPLSPCTPGSHRMGTSQAPADTHLCFSSVPGQVSELVKVSTMSSPKIVLAITDLSLPLGRRVAAKAIAAL